MPSAIPRRRLISVYGPGAGLGKSSLAQALADHLANLGVRTSLIREADVMQMSAFSDYVGQVKNGHADDVDCLLKCCTEFAEELVNTDIDVTVTDSILPCWDWLTTAECSEADVSRFTELLVGEIEALAPILVYVEGDIARGLERAVTNRGKEWALNLAEERSGERTISALLTYLHGLRSSADRQTENWPFSIVRVDTVGQSLQSALKQVVPLVDQVRTR